MEISQPKIIEETAEYAVIYKPPKMHSTPQAQSKGNTLQEWYAKGELLHRLDYDTHGLVLFAKTKKSLDFFKELQNNDRFIKEYSAVSADTLLANNQKDGFPPPPAIELSGFPKTIMSYFRPFGPGRKLVRPVITERKTNKEIAKDNGGFYRTEIIKSSQTESGFYFTVRICRGFRHQIRCHLCWIDRPILNDPLYNTITQESINNKDGQNNILALRAHGLFFEDPSSGKQRKYCIPPLTDDTVDVSLS